MAKLTNTEPLFTVENVKEWCDKLNKEIHAPYVNAKFSTLGGPENVSILMSVSLDSPETWAHKIFENSRYAHYHIYNYGKVDQFSGNYGRKYKTYKPFRKTTFKNVEDLINKLNKYIDNVPNDGEFI